MAALRPTVKGNCAVCGTAFETIKAGRRPRMYCSKRCGARAWRAQKRHEQVTKEDRGGANEGSSGFIAHYGAYLHAGEQ